MLLVPGQHKQVLALVAEDEEAVRVQEWNAGRRVDLAYVENLGEIQLCHLSNRVQMLLSFLTANVACRMTEASRSLADAIELRLAPHIP
jgi:hypothetical protein